MPIPGFECGICYSIYRDKQDAIDCCPPEIHAGFFCEECEEFYRAEEQARECESEHTEVAEAKRNENP